MVGGKGAGAPYQLSLNHFTARFSETGREEEAELERELEGALLRLLALSELNSQELTLDVAARGLRDLIQQTVPIIRLSDIESNVAIFFGLTPADLHTSRKARTVALARAVAMYLARKHTDMSFTVP